MESTNDGNTQCIRAHDTTKTELVWRRILERYERNDELGTSLGVEVLVVVAVDAVAIDECWVWWIARGQCIWVYAVVELQSSRIRFESNVAVVESTIIV